MNTSNPKRAQLSQDAVNFSQQLKALFPLLEGEKDWYSSIYFERTSREHLSVDFKKSDITQQQQQGTVFRIYDGYTLFEQASDATDEKELQTVIRSLIERVRTAQKSDRSLLKKRPYSAVSWSDRLKLTLDSEIRSQIPQNPSQDQCVHFGVRQLHDVASTPRAEAMDQLQMLLKNIRQRSLQCGFAQDQLSFGKIMRRFSFEETVYIDREVFLSQSLPRISQHIILMSGAERVYGAFGGLGGLEAIEVTDANIDSLLKDLKALTEAEALKPGKYRVLCSPEVTGVLAHEAFGHSQEADTCARGRSQAWDLYHSGATVGNEHATILNNPAIYKNGTSDYAAWGSYFFDTEGWFAQEQLICNQGKLTPPMTNLTSAIRLNVPRSANGKRESWSHGVYTRQTNTYFSQGTKTYNELMGMIDDGFLAERSAGGMEDPKGMGIQVGIAYLKEVRSGKLTGRVFKGPTGGDIQLTGYTPDILRSIVSKSKIEFMSEEQDRVAHPENDVGGCGKYHKEYVPAGSGGPYVLLDQVLLG